ncbi:hypothetical protein OIU76_018759 [Salix suchowensis]|nr:hypothetical protein OIU76_018759 [Salix suchowensis]
MSKFFSRTAIGWWSPEEVKAEIDLVFQRKRDSLEQQPVMFLITREGFNWFKDWCRLQWQFNKKILPSLKKSTCNFDDHFQLTCSLIAFDDLHAKSRTRCFKNIAKKKA